MKRNPNPVIKLEDFVPDFANPQSPLQALIRHIARETNRHKLNYAQLKYVFRAVREKCDISAPATSARKLLDLPTAEELERFFAAISDPIHRLIFEALLGTGLRVEELCNLRVDRIDFERNLLFVSEGKGKKDRVTVIGRKLVEKIRLYLKGKKNKFLFESNRHTRFSTRRIEQICERYRKTAGITKKFTPHTARHIWNTRLAEAGITREQRAILAGHAPNSDAQEIYTHMGVGGVKDAVLKVLDGG